MHRQWTGVPFTGKKWCMAIMIIFQGSCQIEQSHLCIFVSAFSFPTFCLSFFHPLTLLSVIVFVFFRLCHCICFLLLSLAFSCSVCFVFLPICLSFLFLIIAPPLSSLPHSFLHMVNHETCSAVHSSLGPMFIIRFLHFIH